MLTTTSPHLYWELVLRKKWSKNVELLKLALNPTFLHFLFGVESSDKPLAPLLDLPFTSEGVISSAVSLMKPLYELEIYLQFCQ